VLRIDFAGHPIRGRSMLHPLSDVTGILADWHDWMLQEGIHPPSSPVSSGNTHKTDGQHL
jgi:hypothetical protein